MGGGSAYWGRKTYWIQYRQSEVVNHILAHPYPPLPLPNPREEALRIHAINLFNKHI